MTADVVLDAVPSDPAAPDAAPLVSCRGVVRVFETVTGRVHAVRGVDLVVGRGTVVAVTGPSGSGKTSLLRMIGGLDEPTAGAITIEGFDLTRLSPRAVRRIRATLIAYVRQRPWDNLLAHLTAREHIERIARRRGIPTGDALQLLTTLGLEDRLDHLPDELSGGEQQRLAFARGAVGRRPLVIADEPTAELDDASADTVVDAVRHLAAAGTTTIIATHDGRVIDRVDETVTLRDGSVASITSGSSELAVIDSSGRLQLPPELRPRFPTGRVRVRVDEETGNVVLEAP